MTTAKRTAVVAALVEGNSVRATARMTDVSKPTILKLLADLGDACTAHHNAHVRNLKTQRIQVDEIWSFIGAKAKNVSDEKKRGLAWGDCWTWNAIDADSKLIISYLVGPRNVHMAYELMKDAASRVAGKVQLTTDGLYYYPHAVEYAFGIDVDYAVLQKRYAGSEHQGALQPPDVRWQHQGGDNRHASLESHQHVVCGAPASFDADGDAEIHAPDERVFKEAGEPHRSKRAVLLPLQLCASASHVARDASDGRRHRGSGVEHRRNRRPLGHI